MTINVSAIPDTELPPACKCSRCASYCDRPGWPTPDEAEHLMDAGHAERLMLDWWCADLDLPRTEVLSPAIVGYEGKDAPDDLAGGPFALLFGSSSSVGGCTFFKDGLCGIHESGAKPLECRAAYHDREEEYEAVENMHLEVARLWNSDRGRSLVARWKAQTLTSQRS